MHLSLWDIEGWDEVGEVHEVGNREKAGSNLTVCMEQM